MSTNGIIAGFLVIAAGYCVAETTNTVSGRLSQSFGKDESGNFSLLGRDRKGARSTKGAMFADMPATNVFVNVNGVDSLTWGELKEYCERRIGNRFAKLPVEGRAADEIRNGLLRQTISKSLQGYIGASVMAIKAREDGITVTPAEIDQQRDLFRKRDPKGAFGAFFERNLTNCMYQARYVEKNVKPGIKVTDAEINAVIARRHQTNLSVPATNAAFRATLEKVRSELLAGKITFEAAVDEYSECPECTGEAGNCGTWYKDDDRDEKLTQAAFALKLDELSQVIETEEAFHLIKPISRYVPKAGDDGEEPSVDIRHIQLDKWQVDPELTKEDAKKLILAKKLKVEIKIKQLELMKKYRIDCVVPLFEKKKTSVRTFK